MQVSRWIVAALLTLSTGHGTAEARGDEAQNRQRRAAELFEAKIRPLFLDRCIECHGPDMQESELRLDSRGALLKGDEVGEVVSIAAPHSGRLLEAVRYGGKIQMPPDAKLADDQISAIEEWLSLGAVWPEVAAQPVTPPSLAERIATARATHWALQPLVMPSPPVVSDESWPLNELDRFVMARLDAVGLKPSPAVERRTWLRRVTYDLTGLPPMMADVAAFEHDVAPDAYERVVDRLLASSAYGERWGRHWLDVARYADTKGYVFTEDRRFPFSYTYRDYVIRAFNEDLPYEQFVSEQLAADRLELGEDKRPLAAMGFLTIGRRFSNNSHDIIDDRIDVVGRGLMGLTIGCARCHDHKYDPISSEDYYALYGVFASCNEPDDKPVIAKPEDSQAYAKYEAELNRRKEDLESFVRAKIAEVESRLREHATAYLLAVVKEEMGTELPDIFDVSLAPEDLNPRVTERWRKYLARTAENDHPVFGPWKRLMDGGAERFAACATSMYDEINEGKLEGVNAVVRQALLEKRPGTMFEVAQLYGDLLKEADRQFVELRKSNPQAEKLEGPAAEELRQVLYGERSPAKLNRENASRFFDREAANRYGKLRTEVEQWELTSPDAPARAMVLVDNDTPYKPHVFTRGNPSRPDKEVARRFPQLLGGKDEHGYERGSGRLELAHAIVAHDNPLTYRVWMNRVWQFHFGTPLVRDPSDFGLRSDPPTHPELLDYLAARFLSEGQSLKAIHRLIVLSNTYRQLSVESAPGREIDPENRLYWRMNSRRLEFEAYRDSLLFAAGRLDATLGGRPVDLNKEPFTTRRTVYGYIDRQVLPELFRTFDFASPDSSTAQRPKTTVPQQALFAMNAPFAIEQAKCLTARPEISDQQEPTERVRALYRTILAREPTEDEVQLGCQFVAAAEQNPSDQLNAWQQYAQVLLMSNEFAFVD